MPDLTEGAGDAGRLALLVPSFKNRFNSDMDPCLACKVEVLSSCKWDRWSLWWPPNIVGCFLSACALTSTALRDDRERVPEVKLGERLCFEFRAVNLNL